ncbi:MAG: hypothetical protein P4M00_18030 [Azospirillaceae bacterium]|nr:hypothetical protein [Azospirillaceae bacterium]
MNGHSTKLACVAAFFLSLLAGPGWTQPPARDEASGVIPSAGRVGITSRCQSGARLHPSARWSAAPVTVALAIAPPSRTKQAAVARGPLTAFAAVTAARPDEVSVPTPAGAE